MTTFINPNTGLRLLKLRDVKGKTALGRSSLYQKIKDGTFPAPIKLGTRAVAWVSDDIDAWISAQIAANRQPNRGI